MRARKKNCVYCINFKIFSPVNFTEFFANFIMWLIGIIVKNTSETVIFCQNEPRKQFTCAPVEKNCHFYCRQFTGLAVFWRARSSIFNGRAYSCLLFSRARFIETFFTCSHVCLSAICANVFIDYYYGHYISGEFWSAFFICTILFIWYQPKIPLFVYFIFVSSNCCCEIISQLQFLLSIPGIF